MIRLQLRFHHKEIYYPSDNKYQLTKNVAYYNLEEYTYKGEIYDSITYKIYYKANGAIGCCYSLFPKSKALGYHDIDGERVKILLRDDKPVYVYFSAHSDEGKWYKWEECETFDDVLVVYVARASHANYPKTGTWWRIFGLANDKCSDKGKTLIPELIFNQKLTYNPPNQEKCYTLRKRLLLPFFL